MKVSVCCITYNHEQYIAAALDSFLTQEVTFDFEIVVGDDCSTDKTTAIINDYKSRYGEQIKIVAHTGNVGMIENFISTLNACTGEYIAFCEGDDYWTNRNKLSKQVQFLDSNPDYCLAYHNCFNLLPNGVLERNTLLPATDRSFDLESINTDWFMPTMSVMIRNTADLYIPEWFTQSTIGDLPFFVLYARAGKMKYFAEPMGAYRIHPQGSWSARGELEKAEAIVAVLDKLLCEDFSTKARLYLEALRKQKLSEGFFYALFKSSVEDYYKFIRNRSYGYDQYIEYDRTTIRLKYQWLFLKKLNLRSRLRRILRKIVLTVREDTNRGKGNS